MVEQAGASIVLLDEAIDGQAMIRMKDGDTFLVAVADAARACSSLEKLKDFGPQFSALLKELNQWVTERRDRIKSAHLSIRAHDMLFLVMQKGVEFDQHLTDELTALDVRIATGCEYNLIDLEVLAIPAVSGNSAKAFLSSGQVYTYA